MREESILLNPIKTSKSSSSVLYTKYGVNPPSVLKTDYNPEYDENIRPIHNYSTINHALTPSTLPVMYSKPISPQVRKTSPVKGLSYISSGSTVPMYSYDLQLPLPPNIQSNVGSEYFFDPKLSEPQPSKYPLPLPDHGYKQRVNYEMVKKYKKSEDEKKNVPKAEEKILEDLCSFNSVALNMPADMQPYKRMEVVTPMPQDKIVEHISISQSKVSPPPNARSYESLLDSFSLHHILLKHGKTITNTPEFESFARAFKFRWSEITAVIICFEEWAAENNIELVLISGRKVAERSLDRDFMGRIGKGGEDIWNKKRIIPTSGGYNSEYQKSNLQNLISNKAFVKKFILPCIVNLDDITAELKKPGHTYNGCIHGKGNAVVLIQSVVRMFLAVQKYKRISRKGVAATIIQRWYRVCRACAKLEKELDISTRFRDKVCSYMQEVLKKDLKKMRGERRLIIHIPSIGWDERIRKSMNTLSETKLSNEIQNDDQKDDESKNKGKEKDNDRKCILFSSLENQELSRLCDLEDPLVDIIMICLFLLFFPIFFCYLQSSPSIPF
jgi:hypothetical protein